MWFGIKIAVFYKHHEAEILLATIRFRKNLSQYSSTLCSARIKTMKSLGSRPNEPMKSRSRHVSLAVAVIVAAVLSDSAIRVRSADHGGVNSCTNLGFLLNRSEKSRQEREAEIEAKRVAAEEKEKEKQRQKEEEEAMKRQQTQEEEEKKRKLKELAALEAEAVKKAGQAARRPLNSFEERRVRRKARSCCDWNRMWRWSAWIAEQSNFNIQCCTCVCDIWDYLSMF